MAQELDPKQVIEQTREAVSRMREMTDDLRAIMDHETMVAGDLMRRLDSPEVDFSSQN